jgi:CheY-like chemotaxis protein
MRRRRRVVDESPAEPTYDRHLLEATIIGPAEEIVTALEEMRAELRGALGELTAARDRERTLELELRATRATAAVDAERLIEGANRAVDALSARIEQVEEHARSREAKLEQAWGETREALAARTHDLETENQRLRADAPNARIAELQATVNQLTNERDIARTTSSSLARRVEELEAAMESASDQTSAELVAARLEISQLQQQLAQSQTEFDDRLQKIVSHLAEDHEADLGNALMEKEAAKAEARAMTGRVHQLQQRLEEDAARRLAQKPPVRARRILVAHPDADLREAARTSLERVGYEVTTAGDGLEGLRVAIAINADVVIADAVMPKMNGRELCQLLKSQQKTSHIKVVLLTRAVDNVSETGELAPDAVLKKPVPFETLRNALNGLLA